MLALAEQQFNNLVIYNFLHSAPMYQQILLGADSSVLPVSGHNFIKILFFSQSKLANIPVNGQRTTLKH